MTEDGAERARGAAVADRARLATVRATGLLDTEVEEAFDRLTRLAVRVVGVPAAFISLVDEHRDFYKSACGFGEPLASARELTGPTFCHFTIQSDAPLVIGDTAADPRYRDIPTVRSLGVAAYVGIPLVVAGQRIGALCAIDTCPRPWSAEDVTLLTELASSAQREIMLRVAERSAQETAARLTVAMDAAQMGAWSHDIGSPMRWNSARANRVLGLPPEDGEIPMAEWLGLVHEEDRARVRDGFGRTSAGEERYGVEHRVRWPDGSEHWVRAAGMLLRDADGRPSRVVGTIEDVTSRKRIEAAKAESDRMLRESEARFRMVQDASPDGGVLMRAVRDEQGRIVDFRISYANASAHRILFESPEESLVGRVLSEAFPESAERFAVYVRVVETGEPWQHDAYYSRGGRQRGLRISAVRSDDGVHIAFADLSERIDAAAERDRMLAAEQAARADAERARREAEQANAVKGQFLATMSHELRTPLNAIGGYAQLIELGVHGPVTPAQCEALGRIQRSQKHLLGLINEVLNYAKIEAGAVSFHTSEVPALEIVRGVEALVAPQAREKDIALQVRADADLVVLADPEKARQVLLNLLSNAVKFTAPGGRVDVRGVAVTGGDGGRPMVALHVVDTGRGIRPDHLERVFEPFVQVGRELTSEQSGTGLGLAISRDLARGMGGEIVAHSQEGMGSEFILMLPRA